MQKIIYSLSYSSRLDRFLQKQLGISVGSIQKLLRTNKIKVNQHNVAINYRLQNQDIISINTILPPASFDQKKSKIKLTTTQINNFWQNKIYEDENIVAINKPSGLSTQGGSGIKISVDDFVQEKKYQLVHRLDKDTSGLLLVAKNSSTANWLYHEFKQKNINKTYFALVFGVVKKTAGEINIPLAKQKFGKNEKVAPCTDYLANLGKPAITKFFCQKTYQNYSLLKLQPITGKTHQLRVHCKEIGHPIINDIKYGGIKVKQPQISKTLCLHSWQINIKNYHQKKDLTITAPTPHWF
jgi:23S rRNA pseudouridine955/2504/2580 synthase